MVCSGIWLGFGGSGGGVNLSDAKSNVVSNWKTLVAQWRGSGEDEEQGRTTEGQGALKGGWDNLQWLKTKGLELV